MLTEDIIAKIGGNPLPPETPQKVRDYYDKLIAEVINNPESESETEIQGRQRCYIRNPPTMKEFIEDPYYLGDILSPSDGTPGLFPYWKTLLIKDFDRNSFVHNLVVTGSLGIGKCTDPSTKVILYSGKTTTVGKLTVGDLLMGDDSTPREVTSTMRGNGEMYSIQPVKGEPFKVNGPHILCLVNTNTSDICEMSVDSYRALKEWRKDELKLYRVGVDFPEKQVPIDPYWLGMWLGFTSRPYLPIMDSELMDYHTSYVETFGLHGDEIKNQNMGKAKVYAGSNRFRGKGMVNPLQDLLRDCNVYKNKHIPDIFKINSDSVRKRILAGLIDTDAEHTFNGCYAFTLSSKKLAEDIVWLCRSLGYAAYLKPKKREIKSINFKGIYWNVSISGAHDIPVLLDRKKSTPRKQIKNVLRTGFKVISEGVGDYCGFELTGNRRFVLGDFTVTHNTYIMVIILLYRIVLTTLLRNPQGFYGLSTGSRIIYNILSVTKSAVTETAFGDAMNFMSNSPYFLEECSYDPSSLYTNFRVPLKNEIYLTAGSKGHHLLGRNIIGVGLDEGNWREGIEANPDESAYKLYDEMRTRINNRFRKSKSFLPAITIIASSAKDESSFTERVITDIQNCADPHAQLVYRNAVYKIKRHVLTLSERWFRVSYGLKNLPPMVLSGWCYEHGDKIDIPEDDPEYQPWDEPVQGAAIEMVPDLYWHEFARRPIVALQSVCGISTGATNKLFQSMVDWEMCLTMSQRESIINPCKNNAETFPLSMEDNLNIWDYLDHDRFLTKIKGQVTPLRHPQAMRYAHLDLAKTSTAGLSICHLTGNKLIENLLQEGKPFEEYRLMVEFDFIFGIKAGKYKNISLVKITDFFIWLRDMCGFQFGLITADQYNSEMPIQSLEGAGFKVKNLSMDRKKAPYHSFRSAVEENRLRFYRHSLLDHEIENLVEGKKKIDHPVNGTKDVSDATAGAYFNAISSDEKQTLRHKNTPALHIDTNMRDHVGNPVEIPITATYDRVRRFEA